MIVPKRSPTARRKLNSRARGAAPGAIEATEWGMGARVIAARTAARAHNVAAESGDWSSSFDVEPLHERGNLADIVIR